MTHLKNRWTVTVSLATIAAKHPPPKEHAMPPGRPADGSRMADKLALEDDEQRERLRHIMATLAGEETIPAAAGAIGIGEEAFRRLRWRALESMAAGIAPRKPGPAPACSTAQTAAIEAVQAQNADLQAENHRLRVALECQRLREEIAVTMPHLLDEGRRSKKKQQTSGETLTDAIAADGQRDGSAPIRDQTRTQATTTQLRARQRPTRQCARRRRQGALRRRQQARLRPAGRRPTRPGRRGMRDQAQRRHDEAGIRRSAVAIVRWAGWCGVSRAEVAAEIGLSAATLRSWCERWQLDHLEPRARGAPVESLSYEQRNELLALLDALGPTVSHREFSRHAPAEIPRRELDRFLDRYRHALAKTQGTTIVNALAWQDAGTVWAMDYTKADAPIDGTYACVLVVRDLASGYQIAALPTESDTAAPVVSCLRQLFAAHGAPLVMKSDNGPHFIAESVQRLLAQHDVLWLPSPGYTPTYNGACEAGVGAIKTRTHHCAARHDRPEQWTCDDVETARLEANRHGRPRGKHSTEPDLAWQRRTPIDAFDRQHFTAQVSANRDAAHAEYRAEHSIALHLPLDRTTTLALERQAITRTLLACNLLTIRRRRVTLPNWRRWGRRIA